MKEGNRDAFDRGSLPELLVGRARQASDRRLVLDATAGMVASALLALLRPPLWIPLSALAFCVATFGVWGILDREAAESRDSRRRLFLGLRTAIAGAGVGAAVVFGFSLFFGVLGRWIS